MTNLPSNYKPKEKDVCKTTKRERRKKLAKFQDTLHRNFGNKQAKGYGEGTANICEICQKRVHKTVGKFDETLKRIVYKCNKC